MGRAQVARARELFVCDGAISKQNAYHAMFNQREEKVPFPLLNLFVFIIYKLAIVVSFLNVMKN